MATLEARRGPMRVVVTHFGLTGRERTRQAERLCRLLPDDQAGLLLVLGDFNEWRPAGAAIRRLAARFGASPSRRTFPTRWPILALDRIWVRPPEALRSLEAHRSTLARVASDHLPLVGALQA